MGELAAPDGTLIDRDQVNREFQTALNAPVPGDAETGAPPKHARAPAGPDGAADRPKRQRTPKAEQPRVTAAASSSGLSDKERADGVAGIVQIAAGIAAFASRGATGPAAVALKADAITLADSAPQLAGACVEVARHDERFARIIDKVAGAGPYGALITVAMATGMQLVRNHKPGASLPGTTDPARLIEAAEAQAEPEPVAA